MQYVPPAGAPAWTPCTILSTQHTPLVRTAHPHCPQLLFDKFLEPLLAFVRRHGTAVPSSEGALVAATCALLQSLLLSTQLQVRGGEGRGRGRRLWQLVAKRIHDRLPSVFFPSRRSSYCPDTGPKKTLPRFAV